MKPVSPGRLAGLDGLRFVCASIVVFGHLNLFPPGYFPDGQLLGKLLTALGLLFNGPAAVIVFFIISGLCIHYPQAAGPAAPIDLREFYCRRFIRIGAPALVVVLVYVAAGQDLAPPEYGVLWSVICEAVYYLLYPGLLALRARSSWRSLIVAATAAALLLALLQLPRLTTNAYPVLGLWTWVIGLPSWLLGCWLAENLHRFPVPSTRRIWAMRGGVLLLSTLLRIAKFHLPAPYGSNVFLLSALALVLVLWLGYELRYFQLHRPWTWIESAGAWSYSLYLIHPLVPALAPVEAEGLLAHWLLIAGAYGAAILFAQAVEMPSHRLAKRAARVLRRGAPALSA